MRLLAAVTGLAALAAASSSEFWNVKQPSQWTPAEIRRLLDDSPWARTVSAEMDPNQMRSGMPPEGGRGGGRWGGGGGGMAPGGGGGGGSWGGGRSRGDEELDARRGMPEFKYIVRWESAAPVRETAGRVESAAAAKLAGWAKEFYVVSVTDVPSERAARPWQQRGGWSGGDPSRARQWQDRILKQTVLKRKGKPPLEAARVETMTVPAGRMRVFLFPRAEPIALEDKAVEFDTALGPIHVKTKFALKKMLWHDALAL